jgi:hypothetical protein
MVERPIIQSARIQGYEVDIFALTGETERGHLSAVALHIGVFLEACVSPTNPESASTSESF